MPNVTSCTAFLCYSGFGVLYNEHFLFQPCTENLFFVLFHEFRVTLSPVLLEMIQSNHALVSPSDLNAILRKDAVYNAAGLAAFDLYDEVRGCFCVDIII